MSVKPIIFSTPMVKALLEGNKNITRRVIKPQPKCKLYYAYAAGRTRDIGKWLYPSQYAIERDGICPPPEGFTVADRNALWTPPCHGDDILWVRESWAMYLDYKTGEPGRKYVYRADGGEGIRVINETDANGRAFAIPVMSWRPSIHLPKEAARIFLRVTQVSVERLRDMPRNDIIREGIASGSVAEFRKLWDSLRKPDDLKKYGWKANPWVWVISFERCEKPEAW